MWCYKYTYVKSILLQLIIFITTIVAGIMSSDESSSSQISVLSSQSGVAQDKLKPHIAEQWEINCIGKFLLSLYHRSLINSENNWTCNKNDIRMEFVKFVNAELRKSLKDLNGTDNVGTLLHRCGFLWNTSRGSPNYMFKKNELFDFRNKELKARDICRVNGDDGEGVDDDILENGSEKEVTSFTGFEDEVSPEHKLEYQGTTMQQRRKNYYPTNMACCICQIDFSTMDSYEEHIQAHNDDSDFEYLQELSQIDSPIFKLSYRLCKNSHYFCFNYVTNTQNLVIEKIIIVRSRSMFYVHDMRVPYEMPTNGSDKFYVDSHLFKKFVEQPVILISHLKDSKDTRIIEEHHFMLSSELPKENFVIIRPKVFKCLFQLPDYFPPIVIRDALRDDFMYEKLMKTSNEFRDYIRNEKILQPQTIGPTLTTLLHVEDMDTIKEYLNLLQHNVTLRSFGDSYSFKLRSKQRVSIESILSSFDDIIITTRRNITADSENLIKLILTNREDMSPDMHVGRIEHINSGRVRFKRFREFDTKLKYTVFFRPPRTTLRYQYRAMKLLPVFMPFLTKFLFPGQLIPKSPSTLNLALFDKTIYNNPDQLQAVRNIAEGPRNDATYIIFGPPGTGKTTTLVESILQVLKRDDTKILVTASSNSACDEIALRLCKALAADLDMPRVIVRIYAKSNESRIDTIDKLLIKHSNLSDNVHFYPDVEVLHEYRIVVCTMSVVAKLGTGNFGRRGISGLYTHLFIDEVAAATEVEALMPITSVMTPKSCLIIAGDNKQLGPILQSKRAEELRLGVSLMDRLLARECYRVNTDTGDYDRSVQTRLRLNFRSHPAIVDLYSAMYYNHDLEAKAKIEDVSLFKDWHMAPSKEYPIIFHCINGNSKTDRNSFSLYNSEEINIVMDYVKDLMYFGINGKEVHESDIGIISPYKKQYLRIREELNLRKWYSIETGSVENFQGREKNIIIVSFVRSRTKTLGFLESPRRLNVTLSRAKTLLILVGNSTTLCINPDFQHIVNECKRHNTLVRNDVTSSEGLVSSNSGNNWNAMDIVNKSLKDLKLKNHSQQFSNPNSNHGNATPLGNKNRKISLGDGGQDQLKLNLELLKALQPLADVNLPDNVSSILTNLNLLNCPRKNEKPQLELQRGKIKANPVKDVNDRDGVGDTTKQDDLNLEILKSLQPLADVNLPENVLNILKTFNLLNCPRKNEKPQQELQRGKRKTKQVKDVNDRDGVGDTTKKDEPKPSTSKTADNLLNHSQAVETKKLHQLNAGKISKRYESRFPSLMSLANTNADTKTPTSIARIRPTKTEPVKSNSVVTIDKDTNGPKIAPTTLLNTRPSSRLTIRTSSSGFSVAPITTTSNSSTVKNCTSTNNSSLLLGSSTSSTTSSSTVKVYPTSLQTTGSTASLFGQPLSTNRTTAKTSLTPNSSTITNRTSSNNSSFSLGSSTGTTTSSSTVKLYPRTSQAIGVTSSINSPSTNHTLSSHYLLGPSNASTNLYLSGTLNRSSATAAKAVINNQTSSTVKNSVAASISSSSLRTSKAPTTSYSTSAVYRPAATVEIYPNTSQNARTNHTSANGSSTSSTKSYNINRAYSNSSFGEGSEAIHYNNFSRPGSSFNYENSSSQSRNSSKSESKCTIS